jgi:hypothetical protein
MTSRTTWKMCFQFINKLIKDMRMINKRKMNRNMKKNKIKKSREKHSKMMTEEMKVRMRVKRLNEIHKNRISRARVRRKRKTMEISLIKMIKEIKIDFINSFFLYNLLLTFILFFYKVFITKG